MKVQLRVSKENFEKYNEELIRHNIIIDDNADLILLEKGYQIDYLMGLKNNEFYKIDVVEVYYIESCAHDIYLHTINDEYRIKDNLKYLESYLDSRIFLRINAANLVNVKHIKKVIPLFGSKFQITLTNNIKLDVNRSYYYRFKERFNL